MKPEDGVMNDRLEIVLVGAGSRELGPACIRDLPLSDPRCDHGLNMMNRRMAS